jgi:hypothetical protein
LVLLYANILKDKINYNLYAALSPARTAISQRQEVENKKAAAAKVSTRAHSLLSPQILSLYILISS